MWPLERAHDGAACVFADLKNALHTLFQGGVPLLNPFQRQQAGDVIFVDVFHLADSFPAGQSYLPRFKHWQTTWLDSNPALWADVSNSMLFLAALDIASLAGFRVDHLVWRRD